MEAARNPGTVARPRHAARPRRSPHTRAARARSRREAPQAGRAARRDPRRTGLSSRRPAVSRVLAEQHELEFVELDIPSIETEAAMLLPESLARRYRALPIRFLEDGYVLVAVADPTNVDVLGRAPARARHAGTRLRRLTRRDRARDRAAPRRASVESRTSSPTPRRPRTTRPSSTSTTTHPPSCSSTGSISKALDLGASDIHFTPQQRRLFVRVRVDGVMRELTSIAGTQAGAVASRLKIMGGLDIAERRAPQDGRVSIRRGDDSHRRADRDPADDTRREGHAANPLAGRSARRRSTRSACGREAAPPSSARSPSRSAPSSSSGRPDRARRRRSTRACRCSTPRIVS